MELNLKNKVALVTGGGRGIGKAICLGLAAEGVRVGVNDVRKEAAVEVAEEIKKKHGIDALALYGDLSKETDIPPMFDALEKAFGGVDVLVNNAAYLPSGPIANYTTEEWEKTFKINVTACFVASKEIVRRLMEKQKPGRIITIVSQAAFRGSTSGHLPYDASKGAMVSFTIALAREVSKHGITVTAVAPGLVRTDMVAAIWEKNKDRYLANIPLQRIAEPEEIANVVTFLASDAAGYMTGTTVDVSGGMMMR